MDTEPQPAAKTPLPHLLIFAIALAIISSLLIYLSTSLIIDGNAILGYILLLVTIALTLYLCIRYFKPYKIHLLIILLIPSVIGLSNTIYRLVENYHLDRESVVLESNLIAKFGDHLTANDFITSLTGDLLNNPEINTQELGKQTVTIEYLNRKHHKRQYQFEITVTDQTAPRIYGQDFYSVPVNYAGDLTNLMLSGDDLDDQPKREIIGSYNLETPGKYALEYRISDASGNQTSKNFTLQVYSPQPQDGSTSSNSLPKLPLANVIKQHKTSNTKIGIDVSSWQGEIDWPTVHAAGVEFAFIRLGYQAGYDGEYVVDKYFKQNIEAALAERLPVGIYFYSYATSPTEATKQANWIKEQISGYKIELGIAFDWEDWSNFNQTNMSFRTINQTANAFLDTLANDGYRGLLYGSKVYLERIWEPERYPVWLAQYYERATYSGEYQIWQLSNTGRVPGIAGDVDLDILYY